MKLEYQYFQYQFVVDLRLLCSESSKSLDALLDKGEGCASEG